MRVLILLFGLLILTQPGLTQGTQQDTRPHVVFVEDARLLQVASVTDNGPDGVSRLGEMFIAQGARTSWIRLTDALPEDTRVIVMVRPRQSLPADYLARIWLQMARGAHLLLAIDPPGQLGARPDPQNNGLDRLLTLDYGVSLLNGLLIEPWFTLGTIREVETSYLFADGDPVPNPIFEPITRYDLPVRLWGARPIRVEPFGIDSEAAALLLASPLYAETTAETLRLSEPTPLELNIETDPQGLMNVAAVGQNTRTGSRIAIIGDGEFLQNGFGLSIIGGSTIPRYAGNTILAQRIVSWLLELDEFPDLPEGLTWLALDGDPTEWESFAPSLTDDAADSSLDLLNLVQVKSFRNDSFVYIELETAAPPSAETQVDIEIDRNRDQRADVIISMQPGRVFAQVGTAEAALVYDAEMAVGQVIELRLPRRLMDGDILSVCLSSARDLAFPQPPDCSESSFAPITVAEIDPVNVRTPREVMLTVTGSNAVNMRVRPGLSANVVNTFTFGAEFAVLGRNDTSDWIYAQDARWTGWFSTAVVRINGDLAALPVIP